MALDASPADRTTLRHAVPVDELARYAGVIGLVTAVLAVAGVLSTSAYLSAWNVPPSVIRLDPLTAALRSDDVVYEVVTLAAIVFGIDYVVRRLAGRPRVRAVLLAAIGAVLGLLVFDAIQHNLAAPVMTAGGGVGLVALYQSGRIRLRAAVAAFLLLALLTAFVGGAERGQLVRTGTARGVPVSITTRAETPGLDGHETGSGWSYAGLYLVFRDAESLYVARPEDSRVWVVPAGNVMSFAIGS